MAEAMALAMLSSTASWVRGAGAGKIRSKRNTAARVAMKTRAIGLARHNAPRRNFAREDEAANLDTVKSLRLSFIREFAALF